MRAAHWTAHESGALFWLCEAVHILQLIKMNNKKLYVYLMDWYWGRLKKETYQCRQKNQFTQGKRMWDVEEAFTSCSGYSIPNYSRWTLTGESTSQPIINKWVGPRSLWLLKNGGASIYWVALTPEFCLGFFFFLEKKLHWSVSFTDFFLLGCEWFNYFHCFFKHLDFQRSRLAQSYL